MSKSPGEVLYEIRTVFDSFKQFFALDLPGRVAQAFPSPPPRSGPASPAQEFFRDMAGVCVRVCAFDELTEHLAGMRATLFHLHRSLATLELCLVVLTAVICLSLLGGLVLASCLLCHKLRGAALPPVGHALGPRVLARGHHFRSHSAAPPGPVARKRVPSRTMSVASSNEYADYVSPDEGSAAALKETQAATILFPEPPVWSTLHVRPQDLRRDPDVQPLPDLSRHHFGPQEDSKETDA